MRSLNFKWIVSDQTKLKHIEILEIFDSNLYAGMIQLFVS